MRLAPLCAPRWARAFGKTSFDGVFGLPRDHAFFGFDLVRALDLRCLPFIVIFLFMDMFDTVDTLVVVGAMMIRGVTGVDWKEPAEGISAFLILAGIPFCFSISDGLALGFTAYPLIMLFSGRGRRVSPLLYLVALMFILRYVCFPVR